MAMMRKLTKALAQFGKHVGNQILKAKAKYLVAALSVGALGTLLGFSIDALFGSSTELRAPLASSPSPNNRYEGPIIDAHGHAFPLDYFSGIGWPDDRWTGEPTPHYTNEQLVDAALAAMNRHNVKVAIISGRFSELDAWRERAPLRFVLSPTTHGDYEQGISQVEKRLESGSVGGIGEMFTQYYGYKFDDELAQQYYELGQRYGVPVQMHTGFTDPQEIRDLGLVDKFRIRNGEPINLEEMLIKYPDMKMQIAHAGYPFLDQTLIIMQLHENVYVDLASVAYVIGKDAFHDYLKAIVQGGPGFSKRIMFGSDFYLWPETQISMTISAIDSAPFLSPEEKSDIFCRNAARFYELDQALCEM